MRLLATLALVITIALGQSVTASPRSDAAYIANRVIQIDTEGLPEILLQPFARFFKKELGKHSAHLRNEEKFIKLMPQTILVPWIDRTREIYIEQLIDLFEPADLERYVIAWNAVDTAGPEDEFDAELAGLGMVIGIQVFQSLFKVSPEISASLESTTLADHAYLADILETQGIFQFSNRILKDQLITNLRSGMKFEN